ncbi:phage antirepressor N-terminal domain-containing protein [Acinetobacter tandoii]|uniref:phage antirepressor N-terminal domain-containing protein n=1 Tax=Acinetobacter tandoii TaxID=202954 RepID=UPI0030171B3B
MTTLTQISVPFHSAELYLVEHNGQPYTPMKPIVDGMGLAWQAQLAKFNSNSQRWGITKIVIPTVGDLQEMVCLPLRKLFAWLMTISPNKVKPELRDTVIMYQNECDDVLWDYWTKGQAINQRKAISPEQQAILHEIVARRSNGERKIYAEMWARHNRHFKIAKYSQLLAIHFSEAIRYLETMELKAKGDIHIDENQTIEMLCGHARLFQAWWNTHSPALAKLNPQLVYMLHDNMFYMTYAISDLCKKYNVELPAYDYQHMFELKTLPHERYSLIK